MKIRMLSTQNGSLDGIKVAKYEAGVEYDLSATAGGRALAQAFVGACMAVEVSALPAVPAESQSEPVAVEPGEHPTPEAKAIDAAPENKAHDIAPKRKGRK